MLFSILTGVVALCSVGKASAQDLLTGDTRLACEAVLCLASGTRPSECAPSLQRYFSITARKLVDTIKKRGNFLELCPTSNQTPEMSALVSAMSRGAGRCDAQSLNQTLVFWQGSGDGGMTYIGNQMPDYCEAYTNHAYTDLSAAKPRYVGTPGRGDGYWVEAADYARALAEYNERIRRDNEERRRGSWGN
jgi:hypothetical protein